MRCLQSKSDDIFFNLATEEYLLRKKSDDYLMIWQSKPVVVVGKHQNLMSEINPGYIRKNKISVARRLSGGGAVYQDYGNINFSFIVNGEKGKLVDFRKFIKPVIEFLEFMGVSTQLGIRNDLFIDNRKISGNAEHVYKERVLHHGTLLYNSNLNELKTSLSALSDSFVDKAVQSNRSSVTNIIDYLKIKPSTDEFIKDLFLYLLHYFTDSCLDEITKEDEFQIAELINSKYSRWEWIFGYSPVYMVKTIIYVENKGYKTELKILKGIIAEVEIIDPFSKFEIQSIIENMIGLKYSYSSLNDYFKQVEMNINTQSDLLNKIL